MARRGRPAKPTALKVLYGSAEHDPQRVNRDEPRPLGIPSMPADLAPAAQEVWRHVMAEMPAGVSMGTDRDVFRIYCEEVALEAEVRSLVARTGVLIAARGHGARAGELVKNPLLGVLRDHATLVRSFAGELGLTPTARTTVHATPKAKDEAMTALLTPRRRTS